MIIPYKDEKLCAKFGKEAFIDGYYVDYWNENIIIEIKGCSGW
jgi:hypothetical protein